MLLFFTAFTLLKVAFLSPVRGATLIGHKGVSERSTEFVLTYRLELQHPFWT